MTDTPLADDRRPFKIAVDFDGTVVDHCFPDIGKPVPGAFVWLNTFWEAGAKLILWTMRSDGEHLHLSNAVAFCLAHKIEFYGINRDPDQDSWSSSPKAYAHVYIDDAAVGCPLRDNPRANGRPMVDWEVVGPMVMQRIEAHKPPKPPALRSRTKRQTPCEIAKGDE